MRHIAASRAKHDVTIYLLQRLLQRSLWGRIQVRNDGWKPHGLQTARKQSLGE